MSASRALTLALVLLAALVGSLNLMVEASFEPQSLQAAEESAIAADFRDWQEFKEFQEFQAWKRAIRERRFEREERSEKRRYFGPENESKRYYGPENEKRSEKKRKGSEGRWSRKEDKGDTRDPPPIDQAALMARYIVNQAGWTSVATISSRKYTLNYPFVNIISFSDGPLGNGTGIPYLFLTPLDFTAQDVYKDNRATLMMTLAQGRYCESKNYDPMDPRCARVVFSGKIVAVKQDNPEYPVAKNAVYGRHPWLAHMPADHHFFFAKLKIGTIAVLDTFGGPKYVDVKDYLNPPNPKARKEYLERYQLDADESDEPDTSDSRKSFAPFVNFL